MGRPKKPTVETEMDRAQEQFDQWDDQVKQVTAARDQEQPPETEKQTKLSSREIRKSNDITLKPLKKISSKEQFNEKFREKYDFAKQYVHFIAENREVIGENIEVWTKKFPGVAAEFWEVPVNKPVWGPRYLAEQIKAKFYRRLKTEEGTITGHDTTGQYYGAMVVDTMNQRLDAFPVNDKRSVFVGDNTL